MRAWYHTKLGFTADLCMLLNRESTRVIIRSPEHTTIFVQVYSTWSAALEALKELGYGWVNDLTGETL